MTAPSAHELEIERLNRLYAALSHVNQSILRSTTREVLFQRVCDVLVRHGGLHMAWIGWRDPETQRLVPVAQAGDHNDYLKTVEIYVDERAEGRGPSGTAYRENRPYICNDLFNDPAAQPWLAESKRRGFRASAALPFHCGGKVCGTLNVYADHVDFFQDKELALLRETAADLSFGLDNLATKAARTKAEGLASTLFEAAPGILYLYDEHGLFLRWNGNFESVSGYSAAEIERMSPLDFFAGDDKQQLQARIAEVFERGESSVEANFVTKSGRAIPYFFTGKRLMLDTTPCLVGMGIDITDRKRAETELIQSEERYRTTLESILEGCQILGFDWRYLYLNEAAAKHNRRPNAELLGKTMLEAWPGIEASHVYAMIQRTMTERVALHEETEFTFPDGTSGWFDVRVQPVPEGVFLLSIDITKRKNAQLALRALNESLEAKVAERTADLKEATTRAEAADRIKSAFLATMSHELRTPLNSIIGFTGIILQGLAGPLNTEQSKQLGMVQNSARHLLELINDVLDLSKVEAGQLEMRLAPFDLRESVEHVIGSVKPHAQRKGLVVDFVMPTTLDALESDRRRVEQILLNLLNNAIKFTDRGGVTLTVDRINDAHPAVRIRVKDTGIGMKPQDLSALFQPFRQIDSGLERQHEGTGLGLAICRRLTDLLGGTLGVESTWGQGSVFTLVLPLRHRATS